MDELKRRVNENAARRQLANECLVAMGGASFELAEILSWFPDHAKRFIKTLERAAEILNKRELWYVVDHKSAGNEYLWMDPEDFPVLVIMDAIQLVKKLRGVTQEADDFYETVESVAFFWPLRRIAMWIKFLNKPFKNFSLCCG